MADDDGYPAIGRILVRASATIGERPAVVFGIAFLLTAVPQLAATLAGGSVTTLDDPALWLFASSGAGLLTSLISVPLTHAALVRVAVEREEGGRASLGQALWSGVRVVVPLVALACLMALAISLAFTLLIVPGVMQWVRWSVATPALAAERCGVLAALGRSSTLTRGVRWRVFALGLVVLTGYWLFTMVFGIGHTILIGSTRLSTLTTVGALGLTVIGKTLAAGVAVIGKTLAAGVAGSIQSALYIELRNWKDGPPSRRLADIFA